MGSDQARKVPVVWISITVVLVAAAPLALLVVSGIVRGNACVDLWNAPDNAAVRSRVAAADLEAAGITSLTFDGPGRVCYVTVFDAAKHARGTYVIRPDNLFDNGSLHEYTGPFVMDRGYERQEIELVPSLPFASDGRLP